ncbi:HAMP domain-containing sensor histidine kinase [Alkalilimnicola ehrlichii]|nr:HAMP domain-containing sensor histidine kinase [Alkalilimnicola ehrlichii]
MNYRNSLRIRLLAAFALVGALLGPVIGFALLLLVFEVEERSVARDIQTELAAVIAQPEQFALRELPGMPGIQVRADVRLDGVPAEVLLLPDGVHEYENLQGSWYVALGTTQDGRFAVIEDVSWLDRPERMLLVILVVATPLGLYLALWLGYYLSKRLLTPLVTLADRVARDNDDLGDKPLAINLKDDEVGALARALDGYRERMQQMLTREREFSADVSHELRNPLAVIQGAVEVIRDDPGLSRRTLKAVERLDNAGERMRDTVNTLLLMVREPSRKLDEAVDVADCVSTLIEHNRQVWPVTPAWVRVAKPTVRAPRAAVEIIVSNLIRNAVTHSGSNEVNVTLESNRLIVSDNGVGIAPEELPRITERGRRGCAAKVEGYGLGLALVQRLCERYGWRLEIETCSEGTQVYWCFAVPACEQ